MVLTPLHEDEIRHVVSQVGDLPPIPHALQRLMEIIHGEANSLEELEGLISQDPSLSAKILRIANSTYFGSRGQVPRLSRALVVIGFEQAKSICLCTLLMEVFSEGMSLAAIERERLWKHAFATARIAFEMARNRPWISPEEAYILGLLHDLGRIVIAVHFGEHYMKMVNMARRANATLWSMERQYGLTHTRIGKWVAVRWAFPEVFQRVMEFHHAPADSPSFKPETRMIGLADILANSIELPDLLIDELTISYCSDLYMTEEEWQEHQDNLDLIRREVDQLWDLLK